ncbi:MAG: hypothetical protein QXM55_05780, partial [Ignisphaera sp.]
RGNTAVPPLTKPISGSRYRSLNREAPRSFLGTGITVKKDKRERNDLIISLELAIVYHLG